MNSVPRDKKGHFIKGYASPHKGKKLNHKNDCQCGVCKAKRGERGGCNHPFFGIQREKFKDTSKMGGIRHDENGNQVNGFFKGHKYSIGLIGYWKGKTRSQEFKNKMSEVTRGEKSVLWRGGVTNLRKQIRNCFKYRQWRQSVFIRDNFSCVNCGKSTKEIKWVEADHYPVSFAQILHNNSIKTIQDAIQCNKFWDIDNGRTLCKECHMKTDNHGRRVLCKG